MQSANSAREFRAKFRATNTQTPQKTREHQRPESKTNQQDREPCEICKTSTPGSNPGGASKIIRKVALLVDVRRNLLLAGVPNSHCEGPARRASTSGSRCSAGVSEIAAATTPEVSRTSDLRQGATRDACRENAHLYRPAGGLEAIRQTMLLVRLDRLRSIGQSIS